MPGSVRGAAGNSRPYRDHEQARLEVSLYPTRCDATASLKAKTSRPIVKILRDTSICWVGTGEFGGPAKWMNWCPKDHFAREISSAGSCLRRDCFVSLESIGWPFAKPFEIVGGKVA